MADRCLSFSRSLHSYSVREHSELITTECKTYHRRWYILVVFSLLAGLQACVWNTWGPITGSAEAVFEWDDGQIALLENWGPITYILSFVLFSWLLDVKGLRISVLVTSTLMCLGCGLRCITTQPNQATWLIHTGQILNGFAAPVVMGAPPLVSSTWFPPNQRATATALATMTSYMGISVSFLVGPFILNPSDAVPKTTIMVNATNKDSLILGKTTLSNVTRNGTNSKAEEAAVSTSRSNIMLYMYIEFGISAFLFLCTLLYFPAKPPKPPSFTAAKKKVDYFEGAKKLMKNCQFWILNVLYGSTTGVFSGWGGVLAVNLLAFKLGQDTAGWIGFYANIAGCVFGLMMARFSDYFTGRMKQFLIIMFIGSTGSFLWFSILCQKFIKFSIVSLYISAILGGCFINGSIPLFYELTVETTYPVAEGIPMALITTSNHLACMLFLVALMIPGIGTMWMNWCMVAICGMCIPLLIVFRERYTRLELDAAGGRGSTMRPRPLRRKRQISERDALLSDEILEESTNMEDKTSGKYRAINA